MAAATDQPTTAPIPAFAPALSPPSATPEPCVTCGYLLNDPAEVCSECGRSQAERDAFLSVQLRQLRFGLLAFYFAHSLFTIAMLIPLAVFVLTPARWTLGVLAMPVLLYCDIKILMPLDALTRQAFARVHALVRVAGYSLVLLVHDQLPRQLIGVGMILLAASFLIAAVQAGRSPRHVKRGARTLWLYSAVSAMLACSLTYLFGAALPWPWQEFMLVVGGSAFVLSLLLSTVGLLMERAHHAENRS